MKLTLEKQIPLAFIVALILLVTISFFSYRRISTLNEAIKWEKHTQEVLLQLDNIQALMVDAETAGRGFFITGDESFLEPFNHTNQVIDENLNQLYNLTVDNAEQTQRIPKLRSLTKERLDLIRQFIDVRRDQGRLNNTIAAQLSAQGKPLMDNIRSLITEMKDAEKNLLKEREANLSDSINGAYRMLVLGSIAGILSLGLANLAIFREIGKLGKAEKDLKNANRNLEKRVVQRTAEISTKNGQLKEQIEKREESEERSRIALEVGGLGTWELNLDGDDGELDERSLKLFGLAAEDFKGASKEAFSRIIKEDMPMVDEAFRRSITNREKFQAEFRIRDRENLIRWNQCSGTPQFDKHGNLTHIVGFCRDVTENKEAEGELRRKEENYRTLFNSIDEGYCIIEMIFDEHEKPVDYRFLQVSPSFAKQTGFTNAQGKTIRELVPQHEDFWFETFGKIALTGEPARFEHRAEAMHRWYDVDAFRFGEPKNRQVALLFNDITKRKQTEAEAEQLLEREQAARKDAEIANRLRDEFLATVSHELRAPLNSILGWARLMQQGKLDKNTMPKAVETIVRNANVQNRLIEDLLDVSRIISGKLRLDVMTVKPISFVEAALETVRPAADAKNISLEIQEDAAVSHISGDPNRLQQVVWNLLSNAIKFTPNDGTVTVEIERNDSFVDIRVKDTGVGIKPEFLPHVFDRFSQADASSIRKFGGLGLGLAIVRHLTEMHGGMVKAHSAGAGAGATFIVKLPLTISPPETEADSGTKSFAVEPETNLSLDGLLILVVDDEEDTRQLLVQSLTNYGATVTTANSAAAALQVISNQKPDVLVSDVGMPDEDGYSLIRKVRALEIDIPAVALTAFTRAQDRMRALAAGFQNHVSKPVEPDELATVIASLTGRLQPPTDGEEAES